MKRFISTFVAIILAVALAGCASPSYYQAAGSSRYFGYADRQVDGPLHRINFVASPAASLDQTYSFAIYRAAELAQSKGATHFEVLEGPVNKDAIERFVGALTELNAPLPAPPNVLHAQSVRYYSPNYLYAPIPPPLPPVQISLLIRLLSAPSLDAAKGFDVQDLLTRLTPKIIRPPVKTT